MDLDRWCKKPRRDYFWVTFAVGGNSKNSLYYRRGLKLKLIRGHIPEEKGFAGHTQKCFFGSQITKHTQNKVNTNKIFVIFEMFSAAKIHMTGHIQPAGHVCCIFSPNFEIGWKYTTHVLDNAALLNDCYCIMWLFVKLLLYLLTLVAKKYIVCINKKGEERKNPWSAMNVQWILFYRCKEGIRF